MDGTQSDRASTLSTERFERDRTIASGRRATCRCSRRFDRASSWGASMGRELGTYRRGILEFIAALGSDGAGRLCKSACRAYQEHRACAAHR